MKDALVILSAGGTGGHIMPAQALALDLVSRGYRVELATDTRGLKYMELFKDIPVHEIKSGTLGAGIKGKIKGALDLGLGILQARALLKKTRPAIVVGFGGYPSFPAVFAAQKMRIPTILHEQNAILGKANAMLAVKAARIASSTPSLRGLEEAEKIRMIFTGNPVRADIAALYNKPYPKLENDGPLNILIMGGSLGAHVFSDVVPKALAQLPADHRARLNIVQQCREEDLEQTQKLYDSAGIKARLSTFIDDVAAQIERCHLFIGRSGASTVAEMSAAGRPAIFVPYPHHKDQQQKMNAETIADAGGGWVMAESGFTPEAVLARIETFLQNPQILFSAAEKARECGRPDAARKLGNLVTAIMSGWNE
ncbi:MAG: undecaprenyldiphospho-muramoylpentapeptide beta-N-acetylglucosaminyltransferase [Rhodospirillales bacterium]|nr:undecaprenyldiphospho-muramoylpentapeptide beta-N-acetylglucosaminyltransferase [Rhodospirillales bacterium]